MSRTNVGTEDARQAEKVPGMFMVLAVSTILALVTLGVSIAVITSA